MKRVVLYFLGGVALCIGVFLWDSQGAVPAGAVGTAGYVALTFDDGPWPGTTRVLLDGLKEREAKATFFVIGKQIATRPELIQRMVQEGHQIGLHTWDHVALRGLGAGEVSRQLEKSRAALVELVGEQDFMLRPPYGFVDETVKQCAGGPIICWSVDTEDWRDEDVARIVKAAVEDVRDGDIILMHDIFRSSVDAALECVDELQRRGFALVTVEELVTLRGREPAAGEVYRKVPPGE